MNIIPEPVELLEAECNALGLYGLPEALPWPPSASTPHECGAGGDRSCHAAPDGREG